MNFPADQDVYAGPVDFLISLGHDVMTAVGAKASRATNTELLQLSEELDRIRFPRDRDVGALVFQKKIQSGVVYLRMKPATIASCHTELQRMLLKHNQDE